MFSDAYNQSKTLYDLKQAVVIYLRAATSSQDPTNYQLQTISALRASFSINKIFKKGQLLILVCLWEAPQTKYCDSVLNLSNKQYMKSHIIRL